MTEFEHDEDAVASLEDTLQAEPEQFDHEIARLRHRRAEQQAREQLVSELTEQGIEVIQRGYTPARSELRYLKLSKDNPIALRDNPQAHADCPGHAAYVETMWSTTEARAVYVCQDWKKYGHLDTMSGSSSAPKQSKTAYEKAELKRAKANNADWRAAEEVRRAKLAEIVQRKTPPKKTQQFLTAALIEGTYELGRAFDRRHSYACPNSSGYRNRAGVPSSTRCRRSCAGPARTTRSCSS